MCSEELPCAIGQQADEGRLDISTTPSATDLVGFTADRNPCDTDSSGEDWLPGGGASSSDSDDEQADNSFSFMRRYCKNCTQRLLPYEPDICMTCGHKTSDDAAVRTALPLDAFRMFYHHCHTFWSESL